MDRVHDASSHSNTGAALQPADLIRLLRTHTRWWAIPAVMCALVAGAYSLIAPRQWQATQTLIIRPEAASVSEERLGKFTDLSEMKTLQETILELAKSQSVVHATLREVGPPSRYGRPAQWPTALDIQDFRGDIDMRPPGGAEFGKTEVFYLSVRNSNRDRAGALAAALCKQLERRMQELRGQNAQGMITELERTVAMANGDLTTQIGRLSAFEAKIGADLAELRSLNAEAGSQSGVSQELQTIESERRASESNLRDNQRLLQLLVAAKDDPQQLLATPNSLLASQPAVSQLKTALVNAQIHTANLLGSRAEAHPFVIAAREAENLIRSRLNSEVTVAIRGLQVDIDLAADRGKSLSAKYDAARARMSRLAEARAEYANLVASVQNHTRLVETARKNLADARARQAGARSASVISRIDGVEAGVWPIGPTRKTITAAGGVGGILIGFGLIFLFANPISTAGVAASGASVLAETMELAASAPVVSSTVDNVASVISPVPAYSKETAQAAGQPAVKPAESSTDVFGMFRGMSLQDAINSVQKRGR